MYALHKGSIFKLKTAMQSHYVMQNIINEMKNSDLY